ncbi:MAG: glycosyltransferase family 2 protein [Planctomycetota bacterium]
MKATPHAQRADSVGRLLTALPVYNEVDAVDEVLDCVSSNADDVLVVNDGSNDGTGGRLARRDAIKVVTHDGNHGYGAALRTAFCYAKRNGYDTLVTIDCDGQHEPQRIRSLAAAIAGCDVVSGSRYLDEALDPTGVPPADRRRINRIVTAELNQQLNLSLTDAFCGFKAYRVSALGKLRLTETGYALPLELWVQAAHHRLRVREAAVPRIYLEAERSFGGALDDADERLAYYRETIARALAATRRPAALEDPMCDQLSSAMGEALATH